MVIQATRFTFADSDDSFDEILKPMLINMLTTMLNDTNLENRRLALGALISATHNKSEIILPHLAQLIPLVMKESKIKPELVREVQMGPFKHKVDDGLEVRKVGEVRSPRISRLNLFRVLMKLYTPLWRELTRVSIQSISLTG